MSLYTTLTLLILLVVVTIDSTTADVWRKDDSPNPAQHTYTPSSTPSDYRFSVYPKVIRPVQLYFQVYGGWDNGEFNITQRDPSMFCVNDPTNHMELLCGHDTHDFTLMGKISNGLLSLNYLTNNPSNDSFGRISEFPSVSGWCNNGSINILVKLHLEYTQSIGTFNFNIHVDIDVIYFAEIVERISAKDNARQISISYGNVLGLASYRLPQIGKPTFYTLTTIVGDIDVLSPYSIIYANSNYQLYNSPIRHSTPEKYIASIIYNSVIYGIGSKDVAIERPFVASYDSRSDKAKYALVRYADRLVLYLY